MKVLVINGPNLDRLGTRQPEIYGKKTLPEIVDELRREAALHQVELADFQSADSLAICEKIQNSDADGIIINPASLTHHDRQLAKALEAYPGPVIEVHISNIAAREPYRRRSIVSPVVKGSIIGLGTSGYQAALIALIQILEEKNEASS
jgi:3-dehydroquinate dehydratase II